MKDSKLRAWWAHRQGLGGAMRGKSPAQILERCGWSRSVGGVGPYLTLFARGATGREAADQAVATLEIHELPAARGCTYVLPARDFALGLSVGRDFAGADMKTALKLGVTEKEIDTLCDTVVKALEGNGPLDPDGIREATGKASRSLGEEGKKKGLTTTLPLALGRLQAEGRIRRVPVNGRLDQQRYRYVHWTPNPLAGRSGSGDAFTELARRFFRWVGPATLGEFQWFSGLGVKATTQAVESLGLVPAEPGGDRLLLPDDVAAFREFEPATTPQYSLVSSLDPITANRREMQSLIDDADRERMVMVDSASKSLGGLADLPSHAILDRGKIVGLWEFEPASGSIVWATFGRKNDARLVAAVEETEAFVRDQLGDARAFSLDSPKSRAGRIESLRRMR